MYREINVFKVLLKQKTPKDIIVCSICLLRD